MSAPKKSLTWKVETRGEAVFMLMFVKVSLARTCHYIQFDPDRGILRGLKTMATGNECYLTSVSGWELEVNGQWGDIVQTGENGRSDLSERTAVETLQVRKKLLMPHNLRSTITAVY